MKNVTLLTLATAIWGMGFVATRWTLSDYSPIWSNSMRYLFAGVISIVLLLISKEKFKAINHKSALICGFLLFLGLATQTIGIAYTTLAKSGFLTTLYAIFTPLLLMFTGVKLKRNYWYCLSLAMVGIAMLCDLEFSNFNKGDLFITISALFFSLHIMAIDKFAKKQNPFNFNLWQCVYIGVISFVFAALYEGVPSFERALDYTEIFKPSPFLGFVIVAIFSSIIAFSIQVKVQAHIKPHIVSVIFLMESVFASFFGYTFFNEMLSFTAMSGCFLILLSVFLIAHTAKET
jgi:drug/metabolite transporter (DMT)-like permease